MTGGLAIFYEDAFRGGGAPVGLQHMVRALSEVRPVVVYGQATAEQPDLGRAVRREYRSVVSLPRRLEAWLAEDQPEVMLVIGFFLPHNPIAVRVAAKQGVPAALHPMSQVADTIFTDRVFTHGCDVPELEQNTLNAERMRDRLAAKASPLAKKAFCMTAGRYMAANAPILAALSDEEARQFRRFFPGFDGRVVPLPWGTDEDSIAPEADTHFYRDTLDLDDDKANLVVWCRLDFTFKGLDRVLEGVRHSVAEHGGPPPFRVYLCGPDYRGGSLAAQRVIDAHGLSETVTVLGPDRYTPGSKAPLRDAEATILLSRWDGSPRTLREAAYFGTPMIVTEETNFADLVRSHDAGIVVDGDDAAAVGKAFVALAAPTTHDQLAAGAARLGRDSTWESIGTRFLDEARAALVSESSR